MPSSRSTSARLSLLSRVFLANVIVVAVALLLLAFTPITITAPVIKSAEAAVLGVGAALLLALDLLLVRRTLKPLQRLTSMIRSIDPLRPGRRLTLTGPADTEVAALTEAFNAMLDRVERERRESARRALVAEEAERLRISRELHDEIGQTLTAVAIRAERAAHEPPEERAATLMDVAATVRASLGDLRRIAHELRPEALDELGLVNALITLCGRVSEQSGLPVRRVLEPGLPALEPDTELVVYRVAQEALTNALRHAGASELTVVVAPRGERLLLSVRDDGRGMPDPLPSDGRGIAGMRERAMLAGGELTIRSWPGEGTEVALVVPPEPGA